MYAYHRIAGMMSSGVGRQSYAFRPNDNIHPFAQEDEDVVVADSNRDAMGAVEAVVADSNRDAMGAVEAVAADPNLVY